MRSSLLWIFAPRQQPRQTITHIYSLYKFSNDVCRAYSSIRENSYKKLILMTLIFDGALGGKPKKPFSLYPKFNFPGHKFVSMENTNFSNSTNNKKKSKFTVRTFEIP